jgi:hypothetical protein
MLAQQLSTSSLDTSLLGQLLVLALIIGSCIAIWLGIARSGRRTPPVAEEVVHQQGRVGALEHRVDRIETQLHTGEATHRQLTAQLAAVVATSEATQVTVMRAETRSEERYNQLLALLMQQRRAD